MLGIRMQNDVQYYKVLVSLKSRTTYKGKEIECSVVTSYHHVDHHR